MSGNKGTCWLPLIFTLTAAIILVVGLTVGLAIVRPIDSLAAVALATPTGIPPISTPTAPTTVVHVATPTISATVVPPTISPTAVPPTPTPQPPTPTPQPPTPTPQPLFEGPFTYGYSFNGRPLQAYRFGTGPSVHAIIGGIHGGYEWNTVVLVSEALKHLQENPDLVPDGVTLYIIPCANPDGYAAGTDRQHGRMNGNGVDLNRNWEYQWQPTATHGTHPVNAGSYAFSEPETAALRGFILERDVEAAIFYHSAMAKVFYGAEREKSATYELAQVVSEATGYPIAEGVPGQITTGDAIDWMSSQGLTGIEVELTTHEDIEWERNLQGLLAFLDWTLPSRR